MSEVIHETARVTIPANLEEKGYKGEAYAQVVEGLGGKFDVRYHVEIDESYARENGASDGFGFAPTTTTHPSVESAKKAADEAVADVANWDSEKYN